MHGIGMELIKVVFMFSLVSELLVCFLGALNKDVKYMPCMMVLMIVPVISVFLRRLVQNFWGFLLGHMLLMCGLFLMPTILTKVLAGIYIAADIIYIYVRRTTGTDDPMSTMQLVLAFAVAFILYMVSGKMEMEYLRPLVLTMFIIHISVYMIYFHQLNVRGALEASAEHLNQATKKLNGINNKIIAFYVIVMLLLIGMGVLLRMDVVFAMIGQLLLLLLRVIVKFLFRGESDDSDIIVGAEEQVAGGEGPGPGAEYVTYQFWLILEKILIAAALVGALVFLIYVLYHFYQKFVRNRVMEQSTSEFEETTVFVEKVARVKKERKSLFEYLNLTNDKKIRHIYAKKVQKQIKAGANVKSSQTVQEIKPVITGEDLGNITSLYEKARYSNQPISKEEVKSIE